MIRRAVFYVNSTKAKAFEMAFSSLRHCRECGIEPLLMSRDRDIWNAQFPDAVSHTAFVNTPEKDDGTALFVFGGDGTVLRALDEFVESDFPVLGINLGRLGFLPEIQTGELRQALQNLAEGQYSVEHRLMLEVSSFSGQVNHRAYATNEVYLTRGLSQRIIAMDVFANGLFVEHYIADGVIVSSPTGSTGYSLSAGGPIIAPDVDCLLINPICPHTLESRPIIVSDESRIEIVLRMKEKREGMQLSADGVMLCNLSNDDRVVIQRSKHDALMIRLPGNHNFFELLKSKLSHWSL